MTYFQAYLLTRLDAIQSFITFLYITASFIIIAAVFMILISAMNLDSRFTDDRRLYWENIQKKSLTYIKISIILIVSCQGIKALIPTTKEAAFIYIAPAIVNNQDIQKTIKKIPELSGLGLEYLGEILKSEIKDIKKEISEQVEEK